MRRTHGILRHGIMAIIAVCWLAIPAFYKVLADPVNAPSLVISQLKITSSNGQFVTLYNAGDTTLDMSKYQLEYFNSYDLSKATSSKLVALSGVVPPHGYFMVSDGALLLCYQLTIDSVSLGFSSTAGLVELLAYSQTSPGSSVTPTLQDYVSWSKTAAGGAQTLPTNTNAFLERLPLNTQNNPNISVPGSGSWQAVQPDPANACGLVTASTGTATTVQTGLNQLLPGTEPPASIVSLDDAGSTTQAASLPDADIGLMAPEITELLPNPSGTGNDASDEFVELYNPNAVAFDLSGFSLQAGTTALHSFTFATGSGLSPHSFTAFYATATGLSLSNSGGQLKLLDPFGNSISATDVYGTANDGQTWALAKGAWYWTTSPTPGGANIINQPPAKKSVAKSTTKTTTTAKTTAAKVKGASTTQPAATATSGAAADSAAVTPIHAWTLALVAALALLYGAYEYRADLANRLHQFRKYLRTRRWGRA